MVRLTRLMADPKQSTGLFVLQLLVAVCACFCLLVGAVCLGLTQTPLVSENPLLSIDISPYDNIVYDVAFQKGLVINANISSQTPFRASLLPSLPNNTVSSLRMCFTVRGEAITGDAQGDVPYPDIATEDSLIIGSCPGGTAGEIPAIPVCYDNVVYLDVNSTALEEQEFSLFVVLDTCNPTDECTCQSLYYLMDSLIWYLVLLAVSTVGMVILCCCCCGCGLLCWGCEAVLSIIAYKNSALSYDPILTYPHTGL